MNKSRILIAGAALFVTLICWSLGRPINGPRDERFHIASVWCAQGVSDNCQFLAKDNAGQPIYLIRTELCVPKNIEETYKRLLIKRVKGACRYETSKNDDRLNLGNVSANPNIFYETDEFFGTNIYQGNSSKNFYKFFSIFILENSSLSIILIRCFSALMLCLFLVSLFLVGNDQVKFGFIISFILTSIPYGIPITAAVSTSSWAFVGCLFSWPFLMSMLNTPKKMIGQKLFCLICFFLSSLMALTSRRETSLYLLATSFTVVIIYLIQPKIMRYRNISIFFLTIITLTLLPISLIDSGRSLGIASPIVQLKYFLTHPTNSLLICAKATRQVISVPLRLLGAEDPDWQPPSIPAIAFLSGMVLFIFILKVLISKQNRLQINFIKTFVVLFFSFCVVANASFPNFSVPFYLIRTGWRGDTFHSRYFLPLLPFFIGIVTVLSFKNIALRVQREFKSMMVVVLTFVHFVCLYANGTIFRENPSWYWQEFPLGINTLTYLGSLSFFVFLILILDTRSSRNEIESSVNGAAIQ